MKSVMKGAHK